MSYTSMINVYILVLEYKKEKVMIYSKDIAKTYSLRLIDDLKKMSEITKYEFTFLTTITLSILTALFPDNECIINSELLGELPNGNLFESNHHLLKSIRHALAHKTKENFNYRSNNREVSKIVLKSRWYPEVTYKLEGFIEIINKIETQIVSEFDIFKRIKELILTENEIVIPKPRTKSHRVKGIGMRRGKEALIYKIVSKEDDSIFYEKGINYDEFNEAFRLLYKNKIFTRKDFDTNLVEVAKEGSCSFTTIGGIFEYIGIAKYTRKGYLFIQI